MNVDIILQMRKQIFEEQIAIKKIRLTRQFKYVYIYKIVKKICIMLLWNDVYLFFKKKTTNWDLKKKYVVQKEMQNRNGTVKKTTVNI